MVTQISSEEQFRSVIASGTVFVDFFATWCGPCRAIAPVLEQLETEYLSIKFFKLDIQEIPKIPTEFEIRALPTFILFKDEKAVEAFKGADPAGIRDILSKHNAS